MLQLMMQRVMMMIMGWGLGENYQFMHANLTAHEWVNINTVSYYPKTQAHRHAAVFKNNLQYNKVLK